MLTDLHTLLQSHQPPIHYEVIAHNAPILSAEEGARYFQISPGQTAPVLILHNGTSYISAVVSGAHGRIDLADMAAQLGHATLRLASRKEVKKITGFDPGAVAMIGLPLPCILDTALLQYDYIYGGTGDPCHTLRISPIDLSTVNKTTIHISCRSAI